MKQGIASVLRYTRMVLFPAMILASVNGISQSGLTNPWAGGLNSCQFCSIDLNLDGHDDLLIFDRHGNRSLTYLNTGWGFEPSPQFSGSLPDLHDWVLSADYNCDGKADLITYSLGGARVFQNISDTVLKFRLVTDMIRSFYYNGYIGILLTPVDYPAITDLDGDGDLDILTFFGLGSYVEYHRNQSMEKYGSCDSLDFRLEDHCWGNFKESEGSNRISLNVPCPYKYAPLPGCVPETGPGSPKHTGSTLLATDLNGDGLNDLLLGDIDFPNLIALMNGGTPDSADMVSQDTLFPSTGLPVRLFSFPSAARIDVDLDGIRDLLVSPFDPSPEISENYRSIWYYKNHGTEAHPVYHFITDRLFLQDMLDFGSGSNPLLADLNMDGLTDLLVGNFGIYDSSWTDDGILRSGYTSCISYFRNSGAGFVQMTGDLAGLKEKSLKGFYPASGDLTGDGYPDLVTGCEDGSLLFCRNTGSGADPPQFHSPVMTYGGIDVGAFSAPQIFDLDRDGLNDLVIGEQAGNLNYYRNTGTAVEAAFSAVTDSLGRINVTNPALSYYGYSTPCFFRLPDGDTRLLVGSEEGRLYYYTGIDGNLSGAFPASDSIFEAAGIPSMPPRTGWRIAPAAASVTNSEKADIILGNFSGGLTYYSKYTNPQVISGTDKQSVKLKNVLKIFPNPADTYFIIKILDSNVREIYYLEIFNSQGVTMFKGQITSEWKVQTTTIPEGLYFLKLSNSNSNSANSKIIVLH